MQLYELDQDIPDGEAKGLFSSLKQLEDLTIGFGCCNAIFRNIKHIPSLATMKELVWHRAHVEPAIEAIVSMRSLRTIRLRKDLPEKSLETIFATLTELRTVDMRRSTLFDELSDTAVAAVSGLPHLTELNVGIDFLYHKLLAALTAAGAFPSLQILRVEMDEPNPKAMEKLQSACIAREPPVRLCITFADDEGEDDIELVGEDWQDFEIEHEMNE